MKEVFAKLALIVGIVLLSLVSTMGLIYIICYFLGFEFTYKLAAGIWFALIFLKLTIKYLSN